MILSLKTLSMLAFSLLIIPTTALATAGYVDNPIPGIAFITPDSSAGSTKTSVIVTISGSGFVPSSVVRINGSDRKTTFVDYSHLFVQLNSSDLSNPDGLYLNVFNGFPGGGYSNSKYFTTNAKAPVAGSNTSNNSQTSSNYSNANQTGGAINSTNSNNDTNANTANGNSSNSGSLAATVIFGSADSFLPSGLIQWVVIAIIVLIIVILARRTFGAREKYQKAPLKIA